MKYYIAYILIITFFVIAPQLTLGEDISFINEFAQFLGILTATSLLVEEIGEGDLG